MALLQIKNNQLEDRKISMLIFEAALKLNAQPCPGFD